MSDNILDELKSLYANLYESSPVVPYKIFFTIHNQKNLSDHDAVGCEGLITHEECLDAPRSLSSRKSPGRDGLIVDFYNHFWPIIGNCVVDSLNWALSNQFLSNGQGWAVIAFIPELSPNFLTQHRFQHLCQSFSYPFETGPS